MIFIGIVLGLLSRSAYADEPAQYLAKGAKGVKINAQDSQG